MFYNFKEKSLYLEGITLNKKAMRKIYLLLSVLFASSLSAQWVAGEAEYIYEFESTETFDVWNFTNRVHRDLFVDFNADGLFEFNIGLNKSGTHEGKYSVNTSLKTDNTEFQFCGWSSVGPQDISFLSAGDTLVCENNFMWHSNNSYSIAHYSYGGFSAWPSHNNGYYFFESLDSDLQGWIELSWNTTGRNVFITLHRIGLNKNVELGVSSTNSLAEAQLQADSIVTFPNPFSDFLILDFPFFALAESKLLIFDATGFLIYETHNNTENRLEITTSAWSTGVYTVLIETPDKVFSSKILKL